MKNTSSVVLININGYKTASANESNDYVCVAIFQYIPLHHIRNAKPTESGTKTRTSEQYQLLFISYFRSPKSLDQMSSLLCNRIQ